MSIAAFDVTSLFAPLTADEFHHRHFVPGEPLARLGAVEDFAMLQSLPELASAASLCNSLRHGTSLFGASGFHGYLGDAREALQFYERNYTIYATDIERSIPALVPLIEDVAYHFGCSDGVSCEAFASRPGAGATMHYDFDVNFQILLRGRKRWKIAANRHIRNPMRSHFALNEKSYERGPDCLIADKDAFPREMPADALDFEAVPGTVVFLPRGAWHETVTTEESIGLNFVLKASTWLHVASRLVANRLLEHVEWRAFTVGALDTDDAEADAGRLAEARVLLSSLKAVVNDLTPEQLLVAPSSSVFSWPRGATPTVVENEGASSLVLSFDSARAPISMKLSGPTREFVKKLVRRTRPFRTEQVVNNLESGPPQFVPHLLAQLVQANLLVEDDSDT